MSFMRFSAAPAGRLGDRTIPWVVYGDPPGDLDGLEGNALGGVNLAQIASSPGAPMFDSNSLFGAHLAGQTLGLSENAPVVVFVHGFQHEPRRPVEPRARSDNPHRCLYHFDETPGGAGSLEERTRHMTPWFARAMLADGRGPSEDCEGVAVGFSYASYGGSPDAFLPGWGQRFLTKIGLTASHREPADSYINAYRDAEIAGYGLAAVLTQLRARLDHEGQFDKRIDILCHSLGARAVMTALALIAQRAPGDQTLARIDRVLLMGGACYWGQAAFALANVAFANSPSKPQFYNFTARSDDVLRYLETRETPLAARLEAEEDLSLQGKHSAMLRRGRTLGRSGKPPQVLYEAVAPDYPDWIDIPMDSGATRRWGQSYGFDLRGRYRYSLGDHWVHYTHPGNWALYRAILHDREGWGVHDIAAELGASAP